MTMRGHVIATGAVEALERLGAGTSDLTLLGLAGDVPRIADLAARSELTSVTTLTLGGCSPDWRNRPTPVAALAALATAPALRQVKTLTLQENVLCDQGAIALSSASWLDTVEELVLLANPELRGPGFAALVARLPALRRLYAEKCPIGPAGAHGLATAKMPLVDLGLQGCAIDEAGGRALFGAPHMETLARLSVTRDFLKGALARLAIRPAAQLTELVLQRCSLSDAGTVDFAKGLAHRSLAELDLSNNLLGDDVALAFAESTGFPVLKKLDLRRNGISAKGAAALGETSAMPALTMVGLTENQLLTGKTSVHEWSGGMWEAGSVVVDEKQTSTQIEQQYVKRSGLTVF